MTKALSIFTLSCFLAVPHWLHGQGNDIPIQDSLRVGPEMRSELDSSLVKETTIKMRQYALAEDFRLVVQKPLIIVLQTEFMPGEATLPPGMLPELGRIADFLDWRFDTEVEIIGHTDSVSPPSSSPFVNNLELSKARTDSIKTYLDRERGILPDRMITYGRGAKEPIADNSTEEGRALNRRVEFLVKSDFVQTVSLDTIVLEDSLEHAVYLPAEAVLGPTIFVLKSEIVGISTLEAQTLSEYIRSEIDSTGFAPTVDPKDIQNVLVEMDLIDSVCTTDSCIKAISRKLSATYAIVWSLTKTGDDYGLDFRYVDLTGDPITKKRIEIDYSGDVDGLIVAIQKSVWDVLSIEPPVDRFPEEEGIRMADIPRLIKEKVDQIGPAYVVGGAALVLVGAGIAIAISGAEREGPPDIIGSPPDWPEP